MRASASSISSDPSSSPTIHSLGGAFSPAATVFLGAGSTCHRVNFLPPMRSTSRPLSLRPEDVVPNWLPSAVTVMSFSVMPRVEVSL